MPRIASLANITSFTATLGKIKEAVYPLTNSGATDPTSQQWRDLYAPSSYQWIPNKGIYVDEGDPITSAESMFQTGGSTFNDPDIASWDVSTITNFFFMFEGCHDFNIDISGWNMQNATNLWGMFTNCWRFNQDIGGWNVSNVTQFGQVFSFTQDFNQDIGGWNVSAGQNFRGMFEASQSFNQNISGWDLSSATDIRQMFYGAQAFNQNLNNWNTSNLTTSAIDAIPQNWATYSPSYENEKNKWPLFGRDGSQFKYYPITNSGSTDPTDSYWRSVAPASATWIAGRGYITGIADPITNMDSMFANNSTFNDSDLQYWDVSSVTNMYSMFISCSAFDANISSWNVGAVTNMSSLFFSATSFNQNIGSWNVGAVTDTSYMFRNANSFNQDISDWTVNNVTDMTQMFYSAAAFNQDLRWWDVSNVLSYGNFAAGNVNASWTNLPFFDQPFNYYPLTNTATDLTYSYWQNNYAPAGGYRFKPNDGIYTLPTEPITNMSTMFSNNSTFNDPDITSWDVSTVTNMRSMFNNAQAFNQDISNWDTSAVTNMSSMFSSQFGLSSPFNQPIGAWDVSSVTDMKYMFSYSTSFNQPIGAWDTSSVTDMRGMFYNATAFNQPIGAWDVSSVTDMRYMFFSARAFNQDLRWWDVSHIAAEPSSQFEPGWSTYAPLTAANKPLWGVIQYGPTFNYYPLTNTATDPTNTTWQNSYAPAGGYRFKPNDGIYTLPGEPITNMNSMFYNNTTFNDQDISSWDTSSVTDMSSMFRSATSFNQDLTGWDVSNVTNYLDFSLYANSSWTLKPIKEITIDSSFSVTFTGIVSTQSYINRYVDIVLFHPSDLGAGGAALTYDPAMALLADVVISLELTSTSFTEPANNNMSQNVLLENPFNANYTTYYSLQNNQQMSEAITYTGDLLPYTNFSNTNNATTGGDYIIRIRCGTNSYDTFLVGQPPIILYDHKTIKFTGNYSLTFSFSF